MKRALQVPTRKDWGDLTIDPEVGYAYRLYSGKTVDEAMPLFIENPIERSAELRYAPLAVFNYYIYCFVDFLLSARAEGEADAASCFLRLVRDRGRADPEAIGAYTELKPAIEAISSRQAFYEADAAIYGAFDDIRREIEGLLSSGRPMAARARNND